MSNPSKTAALYTLASMQTLASGALYVSSEFDVSTVFAADVMIKFGRKVTTALTTGVGFNIEWSAAASGDNEWTPYFPQNILSDTAAVSSQTTSNNESSGQKDIRMGTTSAFTVGGLVTILDVSVDTASEIRRVASITASTKLTMVDNLANAHNSSSTVLTGAQIIPLTLDLSSKLRLRFIADASGAGQATLIKAILNSLDSVG